MYAANYYHMKTMGTGNCNCRDLAITSPRTLISLITMEVGINVEGGLCWKKLVHKYKKRGVEGEKSKKSINVEAGNVRGGWIFFSKSISVTPRLFK